MHFPGNKGDFNNISAAMHPTLHISACQLYEFEPNKTYGARYHLVATPSVNELDFSEFYSKYRTKPKSQIFTEQSELSKIFEGFKSR